MKFQQNRARCARAGKAQDGCVALSETVMSRSLRCAFSGGLALALLAPGAYADEQKEADKEKDKIQRVEVTGSNIKRASIEGPSPIQVLTREDIEKSGAKSVDELIDKISGVTVQPE